MAEVVVRESQIHREKSEQSNLEAFIGDDFILNQEGKKGPRWVSESEATDWL